MSRFWRTRSRRHCLQTELSCCCCSQPAASSDRVLCLWDTVCHRSLDSEPAVFASLSATVSVCVQCTSCRASCHVKLSTCLSHLFFPSLYNVNHHKQLITYSAHLSGNINLLSLFFMRCLILSHSSPPSLCPPAAHTLLFFIWRPAVPEHLNPLSLPSSGPSLSPSPVLPSWSLFSCYPVIWEREKDKHVLEWWQRNVWNPPEEGCHVLLPCYRWTACVYMLTYVCFVRLSLA